MTRHSGSAHVGALKIEDSNETIQGVGHTCNSLINRQRLTTELSMYSRKHLITLPLALAFAGALFTSVTLIAQSKPVSIQGVWQAVEVTIAGRTMKPQPNLTIISGTHYSRTEVQTEEPRPVLPDPIKATADELRAVWGPFVGEAGTYEFSGDHLITMRPIVAKNPAAMANGAFSVYSYHLEGNSMTVTAQRNQNGQVPNSVTIKLARVE
jgi:hypothetical protein